MSKQWAICVVLVAFCAGCGDDAIQKLDSGKLDLGTRDSAVPADHTVPPGVDGPPDGTPPGIDAGGIDATVGVDALPGVAGLPVTEMLTLTGLQGPVEIVRDKYGIPHIYSPSRHDLFFAHGFIQARDRMLQMELLRRAAAGRVAELFGGIAASTIDQDIQLRSLGLYLAAQASWDAEPMDSPVRPALEAYSEGVNAYIAGLRDGSWTLPAGLSAVTLSNWDDWQPVDTISLGKLLSFELSYSASDDIGATQLRQALGAVYNAAGNPDEVARGNIFSDLFRIAPMDPEIVLATGTAPVSPRPPIPPSSRPAAAQPVPIPAELLASARKAANVVNELGLVRKEVRGSNNWIVSGQLSATGHPFMVNDPHLSLSEPPIWHEIHLEELSNDPDKISMVGVAFPGTPGVVLGHNANIAWGATVSNFDVTDVYSETITAGTGGGPDTVLFNGAQVAIQKRHESIKVGLFGSISSSVDFDVEVVPHHGPIFPNVVNHAVVARPATTTQALSVRWTGFGATRELAAFGGLWTAKNVDDAQTALNLFSAGSQNFVVADTAGDLLYTTSSQVPVRAAAAQTWNAVSNPNGAAPFFVLQGTGEAEWGATVPRDQLPHARNPARGFLVSANNDQTGATLDNNPFNDGIFLGGTGYDPGFRAGRITRRLQALVDAGTPFTSDLMASVQADTHSNYGARVTPFFLTAVERFNAEVAQPGTYPDLTGLVAQFTPDQKTRLTQAHDRLKNWTLETPPAVQDPSGMPPTAGEIADSSATSIFNMAQHLAFRRALRDEMTHASLPLEGSFINGFLLMLEHPEQTTLDPVTGDSVYWDDISTPATKETRYMILVLALDEALTALTARFASSDMDTWRWGVLHTVRFASLVPLGGSLDVPADDDPTFANGFPRHGDRFSVDAGDYAPDPNASGATVDFTYAHGPSMRHIVDLTPGALQDFNALPGGETWGDAMDPHQSDEAQYWRVNRNHLTPFYEPDVVSAYEARIQLSP